MLKLDAEILTIGDELNRGEIVDTNSAWLAEELTRLGAHVRWRTSVTDDVGDMEDAIRRAAGRARLVVSTGGLGPTDDDRTVDVVSSLLGVPSVNEPAHEQKLRERAAVRSFLLTPNNLRQIRIPSGARVLGNEKGMAPGFLVSVGKADLICMPGVPREMKGIWVDFAVAEVTALLGSGPATAKRIWRAFGLGESHVDHRLSGLLDGVADATLHFRIAYPETLVTVVVRRDSAELATEVLEGLDIAVRERLGNHVYATGDQTLAAALGARLQARGETIAVAESCTGGMLGQYLTTVPGSSAWFPGGIISYANQAKEALLGVQSSTLAAHGAVSEAVVLEMAAGARARLGATWGVAISGVAGPGGGTVDKPVGTVWLALVGESVQKTHKLVWPTERELVRMMGAFAAMHLVWKSLTQ